MTTEEPFIVGTAPLVVAHRAGNRPASLAAVIGQVDAVEFDAHVFRGRVEVRHEKVLWPTRRLWEKWHLLPAGTPTIGIEEVISALPADFPLLVDLKCFTRRAARRIRLAIPESRPLIVSCRSWWVLGAFRDRSATLALRSCGNRLQMRLVVMIPGLTDQVGIVAHSRLLDDETVVSALRRSPIVFTWAVPTLDRGRELADRGVSGLIIDDPFLDWRNLQRDAAS